MNGYGKLQRMTDRNPAIVVFYPYLAGVFVTIRQLIQHGRDVLAVDHGPKPGDLILLRHHLAGIDQRRRVKANPTSTWRYRTTQEDKAVLARGGDVRPLVTARPAGQSGRTPAETAHRH
jgi:hypothetical protein